jgi:hypothetical protein
MFIIVDVAGVYSFAAIESLGAAFPLIAHLLGRAYAPPHCHVSQDSDESLQAQCSGCQLAAAQSR